MDQIDRMAIVILAHEDGISIAQSERMWIAAIEDADKTGHRGDCTKEPMPCSRCLVDRLRSDCKAYLQYILQA